MGGRHAAEPGCRQHNPPAILREAEHLQGQRGEAAAESICLDVSECLSDSAVPLPREVLAGPHDTRWGITSPGQYGQVEGPPR